MSQVITDKTFNEETDKGLVLIDFRANPHCLLAARDRIQAGAAMS